MFRRWSHAFAAGLLLAAFARSDLRAQTRRALLIGINHYPAPPGADTAGWVGPSGRARVPDLDGAVNDVAAMQDLLRARFGFEAAHLRSLTDSAATHDAILAAIEQLIAEAQTGDVVVFFYAGHGSERRNSLSARATKVDQTIVPVGANAGGFDIRDKELARAFNRLLAKGVTLTLIFDSCHSGAITRGIPVTAKERWAAMDPRDVRDPETPPAPEDHGALVLSSAQDFQTAAETKDDAGAAHGVFTSALLAVLRSAPPSEPATRVFQRVKAIMQSGGRTQEPVLGGTPDRIRQPLLGGAQAGEGRTTVSVLRYGAPGEVELQGGIAIGVRERAELVPYGRVLVAPLRLRVTAVSGLSSATAQVVEGTRDSIRPGDLFEIDKWAPPPAAGLRVWLPPATDAAALARLVPELAILQRSTAVQWVDDPTDLSGDSVPLVIVAPRSTEWTVEIAGRSVAQLASFSAKAVLAALPRGPRPRLFVSLPVSRDVASRLDLGGGTRNDLAQIVPERSLAHYLLVGRFYEGHIEYAWVRPNASRDMALQSTLPIRTDWVAPASGHADSVVVATLVDQALRLARIRSWLEMETPPGGAFPYHLAFKDLATGRLFTDGPMVDGQTYGMALVADAPQSISLARRRVYVFVINTKGESVLLFPVSNVLNLVPYEPDSTARYPAQIQIGPAQAISVGPPLGMDTYVLLTSDQVVPVDALQWSGVRTRGAGVESPLAGLLFDATTATRSATPPVPQNWSIERLPILSVSKP